MSGQSVVGEKRILIVDDYVHSLEGLQWTLTSEGEVETAADGWQAIRKVKEGTFDLALIDLDLPPVFGLIVSGWDLVLIFRAFQPEMAIVVMGSDGSPEAKDRAEQLKVTQFLEKPIDLAELKSIIKTLDG